MKNDVPIRKEFSMKKKLLSLAAVLLLSGCGDASETQKSTEKPTETPEITETVTEEKDTSVDVVLLYGQSNMEGHTWSQYLVSSVGKDRTLEFNRGYEDVLISYECTYNGNSSKKQFVPAKVGQGRTTSHIGPELGMASYFHQKQKMVYMIKYAKGSTNLYQEWHGYTGGMMGMLYRDAMDYTIEQLELLRQQGLEPKVRAICFSQGEADATSAAYSKYYENESNMLHDMREELEDYTPEGGIGFVDMGLTDNPVITYGDFVNEQKTRIADEDDNCYYLDVRELGLEYKNEPTGNPDYWHFDSASMVRLGELYAETIVEHFLGN